MEITQLGTMLAGEKLWYPNKIDVFAPHFDGVTMISQLWAKWMLKKIAPSYPKIEILMGENTIRHNVEEALRTKPDLVTHWDHGAPDKWGGHNKDIIVDLNNVSLLRDTHVYSFSCSSAAQLGPESVRQGAYSYVGFRQSAMLYQYAAYFQGAAAIDYPVRLTQQLEALGLDKPSPELERAVVHKVFSEHKMENLKWAGCALVTGMGTLIMLWNWLILTLCLPDEEDGETRLF